MVVDLLNNLKYLAEDEQMILENLQKNIDTFEAKTLQANAQRYGTIRTKKILQQCADGCELPSSSQGFQRPDHDITVILDEAKEYVSLTDMLKAKDGDFFISDWLRNRNTVEYLGIWDSVYNPNFNYGEFAIIKSQGGLNSYK